MPHLCIHVVVDGATEQVQLAPRLSALGQLQRALPQAPGPGPARPLGQLLQLRHLRESEEQEGHTV